VELADGVINELKHGNLKARFPIRRMDEVGEFMNRFNQMADEIERVVEQMRNGERARMTLLQDLAHDLRTPVASMKHMLEILQLRDAGLDTQTRLKLLGLSILEVDYFARLVEDLLVLAQVNEPRYQANQSVLNMNELLLAEIERLEQLPSRDPALSIEKALLLDALPIRGDEQLLRRMLRNVLDNAASFARSRVSVKLEKIDSMKIRLTVEDDGPGFSPEALRCYGERRISRSLGSASANSEPGRVSVGLGSVIARTIAHLHRGNVLAQNSGSGACVVFTLPSEAERG
jgi:K+-sensing histidine kinase KdpD